MYLNSEYHLENLAKVREKGIKNATLARIKISIDKMDEYNKNPNLCQNCNKPILHLKYHNKLHQTKIKKFCSQSCAAIFYNSPKKKFIKIKKEKKINLKINCIKCQKIIPEKNKTKMCKKCYNISDLAMKQRGKTFSKHHQYMVNPFTSQEHYIMSNLEKIFFEKCVENNILFCKAETISYIDNKGKSHLYFPSLQTFIEIKGYLTEEDKLKYKLVKEQNNINLIILYKKDINIFFTNLLQYTTRMMVD